MAGILAVGEVTDGRVASVTHELTAAGKTLDQTLGEGVSVVLMGEGIANLASEVTARGADKVYLVDDPLLKDSQIDAYVQKLEERYDSAAMLDGGDMPQPDEMVKELEEFLKGRQRGHGGDAT